MARFTWVAGSVRSVIDGQDRQGPGAIGAAAVGLVYDSTTRLLERTGPAIHLNGTLSTSIVRADDIEATRSAPPAPVEAGPDRPLRIAWAGRIAAEKGLDDLLDAVAILRDRGRVICLDVVGDGPERENLLARASDLGLTGQVRWLGFIGDRSAYFASLRGADLFVLPSHAEGMPKVLVEAMAAGLPVVATPVGAVAGVLGDGRLGRLAPVGRPDRLADAIAALADDPVARATLREQGLAHAEAHTADAQAERLIAWMRRTFPALPWLDGPDA